jgi:hypothetical protein
VAKQQINDKERIMKIEDVIKELEEAENFLGIEDYIDEECIKAAIDFLIDYQQIMNEEEVNESIKSL